MVEFGTGAPLDGIRAKLDRADEHLLALDAEVHQFLESEPFELPTLDVAQRR